MTLKKRKTQKQNQKKEKKNHKQNKTQLGKNKPFRTVLTTELKMNWEDSKVIREKKNIAVIRFLKDNPKYLFFNLASTLIYLPVSHEIMAPGTFSSYLIKAFPPPKKHLLCFAQ